MTDHTPSWYPSNTPDDRSSQEPPPSTALAPLEDPMHPPARPSRRKFLGFAAAGVATVGGASFALNPNGDALSLPGTLPGVSSDAPSNESTTTTRPLVASEDVAGRTLVVIELQGGNDGLATLVPRNSGVLYDRREGVHIPDEELLDFTDEYGWNPSLAGLSNHGIAALVGLGTTNNPDGSHFEMEKRWWAGRSSGADLPATGFFGRLCDQLVTDQPVTGVALGSGPSPSLRSDKAVTVGLADPESGWFLRNEDLWFQNLRRGMAAMSPDDGSGGGPLASARNGLSDTLAFAEVLNEIDNERIRDAYPNGDLAFTLGVAAELIRQDAGLRVLHLSHGGFDTHSDQRGSHNYLLAQLGDAMGAFLSDLGSLGLAESTLVCTTSEFGRRVADNRGGTDHGAAGMAMLAGPVAAGVHGESPSLTRLDDDNLIATVDFEEYYATIAEKWFGIPSSEVLESAPAPIDGLITA